MFRTALAAIILALGAQAQAEVIAYPTHECVDSLVYDARLFEIAGKVALGRSDQTDADMLALDRPAAAAEQKALALWSKLRQFCFELGAAFRSEHIDPNQAALAGRLFALHQGLLAELREGRITFAEFNRRRVETYRLAAALEAEILDAAEVTPAVHHEI